MKALIDVGGISHEVEVLGDGRIKVDGEILRPGAAIVNGATATVGGRVHSFRVLHIARGGLSARAGPVQIRAPMHGKIVCVATVGQSVRQGEPVFVLEAMKMQNEVKSPADGTVRRVMARAGDVVESGRVLMELGTP